MATRAAGMDIPQWTPALLGSPGFLRWQLAKILWASLFIVTWALVYFRLGDEVPSANGLPIVGLAIDQRIPFVPATVWPYVGGFIFSVWAPVLLLQGREGFAGFMLSMIIASLICFSFYAVLPLDYPRPSVDPLGATLGATPLNVIAIPGDQWSGRLVYWLYSRDPSSCTFPSSHVTVAVCAALALRREFRRFGIVMVVLTAILMITTLTTKQHFFVDGIAGIVCGWLANRVAFACIRGWRSVARLT